MLRKIWDERPLALILGLAVVFRLLASIFAKGWGMLDDHFIVIESAGSWTAGHDYNDWLPGSPGNHGPTGHNLFYPGLHYLLFSLMNTLGLTNPQGKMFIVRILHGALSLITVYLGYRITEITGGKKSARLAGILLALYWFMPWMSVRNLVEMTCIPFMITGYYFILRNRDENKPGMDWLIAGVMFGLAFCFRPQTVFFPFSIGLIYLFTGKWKPLGFLAIGSVVIVTLIEGGIDFVMWGKPFAELLEYFNVCMTGRLGYITLPWYNYFLTIFAMLIPPVSFFLFFGLFRKWKENLLLLLPVVIYFVFHSWFPNKQERFILPMIPFFIILGSIGWTGFAADSSFWQKNRKLYRFSWGFFWVVNCLGLLLMTFTYSKKARVEAMTWLSRYKDIPAIVVLDEDNSPELMPKFYLGQWPVSYNEYEGDRSADSILAVTVKFSGIKAPAFFLFTGDQKVGPLISKAKEKFPGLVYETTIEPGFLDQLVHWLNPINKNRRIFIYRNTAVFPQPVR